MNKRDTLIAVLVSASLVVFLMPIARMGADFHHDGIMLKPALDVLAGQALFRDTFTQYGALTTYLHVVALWIQPSLFAIKLLTVAAYGVTLFFLYASWRQILPRSLTLFSCGLFSLFIPLYEKNWLGEYWTLVPWSSVFAMMFQSIGLLAMLRVIRGDQTGRWGAVLGVACACAFWCRQPVGVLMVGSIVTIGLSLQWTNWAPPHQSKRSILLGICGGFVAVNAFFLVNILISDSLPEWWHQNFVWPRQWVSDAHILFGFAGSFMHPAAGAALFIILAAAAIPAIVRTFRPDLYSRSLMVYFLCLGGPLIWQHERVCRLFALREGGWTVLFPIVVLLQVVISLALAVVNRGTAKITEYYLVSALAVFSLGSLPQYYPIPDPLHVVWALAPAFGLLTFAFWRWSGWPPFVVAVALTGIFLPTLWAKIQSGTRALARPMVTLTHPPVLRGMKVPLEQARSIDQIAGCIEEIMRFRPDIPSAMIGNDAMYLCFTPNRENPSPYFVTWPGLTPEAHNQQRWSQILSIRPLLFLHGAKWDAVNDFYRRSRYVPLLYVSDQAVEIAVPQELADAMGRTTYGAKKSP